MIPPIELSTENETDLEKRIVDQLIRDNEHRFHSNPEPGCIKEEEKEEQNMELVRELKMEAAFVIKQYQKRN